MEQADLLSVALSCRFLRQRQKEHRRTLWTNFDRQVFLTLALTSVPHKSEAYLLWCYNYALKEEGEEGTARGLRACWGDYFPLYAAHFGYLDLLKHFESEGCLIDESTCERAALGGHTK